MRLVIILLTILACIKPVHADQEGTTLKEGVITYSAGYYMAGQPIPVGPDPYGYNYQARKFNGSYFNSYANSAGFPPYNGEDTAYLSENPTVVNHWAWQYRDVQLAMKWNDAWLSNIDRDGDGKLDRHHGHSSYIGSGAWITNHQYGSYNDSEGEQHWNYFVKIIAAPDTATSSGGLWYDSDGTEIGQIIWNDFAMTQFIYNDTGTGEHGKGYSSPVGPGLGSGKWN